MTINKKHAGGSSPPSSKSKATTLPAGPAGKVQLRAGTPDAVLAVVPHLLGFYPGRSLVVLGLGDKGRVMITFRYDLPEPADGEAAADIAGHAAYVLSRERLSEAMLVGYGPEPLVMPVVTSTARRMANSGIRLPEVLRADAGRYWSLLCADPACCPPDGRSYDPGSHPAAAAMTEAGLSAYPDREALERTLQRPAGSADLVARATNLAQARLAGVVSQGEADGHRDPKLRVARIGRKEIQRAIRVYRSGGSIARVDRLAWLAVLLADLRVRDDAWARMHPAYSHQHCRLWADVLRSAARAYAPAPASLLAFTAWQAGNGALATMALDRALTAKPEYSMARLLADAIEAALPPTAARMPMTPAAVAASYAPTPVGSSGRQSRSGRASGSGQAQRSGLRSGSRQARRSRSGQYKRACSGPTGG